MTVSFILMCPSQGPQNKVEAEQNFKRCNTDTRLILVLTSSKSRGTRKKNHEKTFTLNVIFSCSLFSDSHSCDSVTD